MLFTQLSIAFVLFSELSTVFTVCPNNIMSDFITLYTVSYKK